MTILLVISRKFYILVILKAESFYYYPIYDHMTNIKQNNKKKVFSMFELSPYNLGFITKENFYKFHSKN